MTETTDNNPIYTTVAMAEILLNQNLIQESARVVANLQKEQDTPRVRALANRLKEIQQTPEAVRVKRQNKDSVAISKKGRAIRLRWEFTDDGLAMAKRTARYSGDEVVRFFSAIPGPRGVRTWTRDIALNTPAARLDLFGLPTPAVHVAAVGFLSRTGEFVPLAHSETLVTWP